MKKVFGRLDKYFEYWSWGTSARNLKAPSLCKVEKESEKKVLLQGAL